MMMGVNSFRMMINFQESKNLITKKYLPVIADG